MIEYDFTKGLYRAFVRTTYRDGLMQEQSVDGNKFRFEPGSNLYIFKSNPNVVVNIQTNKPNPPVQIVDTEEYCGLTFTLYDNYLCIISGGQNEVIDAYDYSSKPFISDAHYIYVATDANILGGGLFYNYNTEEIAFFGNTSNMISMENMFSSLSLYYIELHNFNTSSVTTMKAAFNISAEHVNLTTIDFNSWDTHNVIDMSEMFENAVGDLDLSNWDVSNVENISGMFSDSVLTSLNLNNWELNNLEYHTNQYPFGLQPHRLPSVLYCPESITDSCNVYFSDPSGDYAKMYDSNGNEYVQMPGDNITLTEERPITYYTFSTNPNIRVDENRLICPDSLISNTLELNGLTYDLYNNGLLIIYGTMTGSVNPNNIPYDIYNPTRYIYFAGSNAYYDHLFGSVFYNTLEIAMMDKYPYRTGARSAEEMFENCRSLLNIDFGYYFYTYGITNMASMFAYCSSLTSLDLDISSAMGFNTMQVTTMSAMFAGCTNLTSINFGQNFTTSRVIQTSEMFYNCRSLTALNLSSWASLYKLEDAESMFAGCSSLQSIDFGDISVISSTSGYYSTAHMFDGCSSLVNLNLNDFRTTYVVDFEGMFKNCSSLKHLDFGGSSCRMGNAYSGEDMLSGCTNLEYFFTPSPRSVIINLPRVMYDSSHNSYTSLPTVSNNYDHKTLSYIDSPT